MSKSRTHSGAPAPSLKRAHAAFNQGRFFAALQAIEPLHCRQPANPQVTHLYALCLLETGQAPLALPLLQALNKKQPGHALLLGHLGLCHLRLYQYKEALAALRTSLAINPQQERVLINASSACLGLEQFQLALDLASQAQQSFPQSAQPLFALGQVHSDLLRLEQAEKYLRQGLKLAPDDLLGREALASLLLRREELEEGLEIYRQLAEVRPTTNVLHNYGVALSGVGRVAEANGVYQTALRQVIAARGLGRVPKPKNAMRHEPALIALAALKQALDTLKIPFFLLAGTFLGIHRSGALLPNDKDMDVGLPWATPRLPLAEALKSFGFIVPAEKRMREGRYGQWVFHVGHLATRISIDLFFAKREGEHIILGVDHQPMPVRWKLRRFGLKPIEFNGQEFLAPDPPEQYLEDFYGPDWRTPQHYDCVLRGHSLIPDSREVSLCYGYNRLLDLMNRCNWKKAAAYCRQMQLVTDDPLVLEALEVVEERLADEAKEGEA